MVSAPASGGGGQVLSDSKLETWKGSCEQWFGEPWADIWGKIWDLGFGPVCVEMTKPRRRPVDWVW